MCSSGDSRRAEADATDGDALSGFHSWGAEAALSLFARESSGTACGEERCAGSFWTNGVRGDASERLLVSYGASCLPKTRRGRGRVTAAA